MEKTNKHLINVATKAYEQICYLQKIESTLTEDCTKDGFTEPTIIAEVYTTATLKELKLKNRMLPTAELTGTTLYLWKRDKTEKGLTLNDFLYHSFPEEAIAQSDLDWKQLKKTGRWCYGMYKLVLSTGYSLLDLMEKLRFGCNVSLHTSKIQTIEEILENKNNLDAAYHWDNLYKLL